jgi:hypothetical protein
MSAPEELSGLRSPLRCCYFVFFTVNFSFKRSSYFIRKYIIIHLKEKLIYCILTSLRILILTSVFSAIIRVILSLYISFAQDLLLATRNLLLYCAILSLYTSFAQDLLLATRSLLLCCAILSLYTSFAQRLLLATRSLLLLCFAILSLYLLRICCWQREACCCCAALYCPFIQVCSGSAVGDEKPAVVLRYTVPLFAQDLLLATRSLLLLL